jgi:hypothetical protein
MLKDNWEIGTSKMTKLTGVLDQVLVKGHIIESATLMGKCAH